MRRYYLSSAAIHIFLAAAILFSPFFRRSGPTMMIEGFEFVGGGGGKGTESAGPKKEQMGQVVPQPVKVPVPEKAGPVQKETKAEDAWKVNKKPVKPEKTVEKPAPPIERAEKTQEEKTNIIRRGVAPNTKPSEGGFDFGAEPGKGESQGKGVGIGMGPGEGPGFGGFGGYLKIVRQRIWSEWSQSAVMGSNEECIVAFTIARSGEVSNIALDKSSGNGFYDQIGMRAVRNAAPMPPLPADFPKSEQRVRILFRLTE